MPTMVRRAGLVCAGVAILAGASAALIGQATPAAPDGREIYGTKCATCHGLDGRGNGPAASHLAIRPRDLTTGTYKLRSTPSGSLPTDDDIFRVVSDGVPGTSMIAWKDVLAEPQRRAVVSYVKSLSPRFAAESPTALTLGPDVPATPESVEAGRGLYASLQCGTCHGEAGQAGTAAIQVFEDDWGQPIVPARLTEPWTFKGGSSARELVLRLEAGLDGTPMPALADAVPERDLWHLANYVRSLARKPVWEMNASELQAHYAAQADERRQNPVERGRHLAEVCAHCHSPTDAQGRILPGLRFAGGLRMKLSVWDTVVTTNLTSDPETGLGGYSDDEILRVVTKGIRRDGSRMLPFPMGWTAWAHLTDDDQRALVAYLRTIPPVKNRIPPRSSPSFFPYLIDKFRMLILGADEPMLLYTGNAGTPVTQPAGSQEAGR